MEEYYGWIYCIKNIKNNKRYIGQTSDRGGYHVRWNKHIKQLRNNNHIGRNGKPDHLQNSWNKYGEENFEFILLHELIFDNEEDRRCMLDLIEKIYIAGWNLLDDRYGYNISSGGSNGNNFAGKSEEEMNEIKNKMSENRIGEKNGFYGKKHSDESKLKMSKTTRDMSIGKNNPFYGKHHTEETKKKISENNKYYYGKNHHNSKKVAMINKDTDEVIMIFDSVADANEYLGKSRRNKNICNGARNNKIVYGYKWMYINKINQ